VNPKACLDDVEKGKSLTLPELEIGPLGHPARNQSLYRLRHPGYDLKPYVLMYQAMNAYMQKQVKLLEFSISAKTEVGNN
jgi:hypothetical protein